MINKCNLVNYQPCCRFDCRVNSLKLIPFLMVNKQHLAIRKTSLANDSEETPEHAQIIIKKLTQIMYLSNL
jgi:hypothetical protein